jgi:hypothetical protein
MISQETPLLLNSQQKPAAGVRLFLVEDEGILFDQVGQQLFHLNSAAACIWCYIEADLPLASIVEEAAHSMRLGHRLARRFVLNIVRTWSGLSLLEGGPQRKALMRQSRPSPELEVGLTHPLPEELGTISKRRHYRLLDTNFYIGFSNELLEEVVHPVLSHLEWAPPGSATLRLDIVLRWGKLQVWYVGKCMGSCTTIRQLAPLVQGIVSKMALQRYRFLIALHAAGIALGDQAMLLVAGSGCGKTTLAAALVAGGWDYLSDDMILLQPGTLAAVGVPYSFGIKRGGWDLLAPYYPGRPLPDSHLRPDRKLVRYLSPPPPRCGFAPPRTVRWIVFLNRGAISSGELRPLGRLEGLQRLIQHCCGIPTALVSSDVHCLIAWSEEVRWFELEFTELTIAIRTLSGVGAVPNEPAV